MTNGGLLEIAFLALERAACEWGVDPRLLVLALGYLVRAETAPTPCRAALDGRVISYRWDPDPREWGTNVFIGLALALLVERGLSQSDANVARLAGYLASPGEDDEEHPFVRPEFLRSHVRALANSRSGVYRAS